MHFVIQTPSLQHLAGVKLVVHLWNQRDHLLEQTFQRLDENFTEWKAIEEKVESKVSSLPLPQLCKQTLVNFVKPIGREIIAWCRYHNKKTADFQYLHILLGNHLRWSMHGVIDYAKTAELMVRDERVDVEQRYRIACLNCLEDEARQLMQSILENVSREVINKRTYIVEMDHHFLISHFNHILNGKVDDDVIRTFSPSLFPGGSINAYLFSVTLASGTRATCEYFFEKLNSEEKVQVVIECQRPSFKRVQRSPFCGGLYYLSLMNKENQESMFGERTGELLECLLRWPMHSLFMEAVECGRQFMDWRACFSSLFTIVCKIYLGFRDYDYSYLFWEIWRVTTGEHKRDLLENFALIDLLLGTKREEFIKLILNEAPALSILELCTRLDFCFGEVLKDESVISDAALMECKQAALLCSSNNEGNAEKRLRSQHLTTLVDILIDRRVEKRKLI